MKFLPSAKFVYKIIIIKEVKHDDMFIPNLEIGITSIDTSSRCSTAHFVVDTPPTGIVGLKTLAATKNKII